MEISRMLSAKNPFATVSFWLFFLGLSLVMTNCANPIAPTGGPKDEQPPQIDSTKSTPNLQTQFNQRFFELTFDEWVVLKDVRQQVLVSPPLDFELSLKRRTVRFEVKEGDSLRANTTYTINFGEAIQDLNEGNPAENLRFVFSTGDVLDSLSVKGQLFDILTRKPVEDAYFMLYDNLADSVVRTERPYYFGQTDENGQFLIENLRAGTYKAFALLPSGVSGYLYNNSGEQIGFPDSLVVIEPNNVLDLKIPLFVEEKALRFFNAETNNFGLIKMLFNQVPPDDIELILPDSVDFDYFETEVVKDSLLLWYNTSEEGPWQLIITRDTTLRDTVKVPAFDKNASLASNQLRRAGRQSGGTTGLAPQQPIELEWNHPLAFFAADRIQLLKDSVELENYTIELDSVASLQPGQIRRIRIRASLQQDSLYELLVLPGAVTDIFGITNLDTVNVRYQIGKLENFGNLIINITELDSTKNYLVELRQGENLLDTFHVDSVSSYEFDKRILKPQKYVIRIIEDLNGNWQWDTGSYEERRQPEPIYTKELEQLRANWDLEESISLPDLKVIVLPDKKPGSR